MPSRLRPRRSRLAGWSRWAALGAGLLLVASVVAYRGGGIGFALVQAGLGVAVGLALFAVIAAICAFAGIWRDGRRGFGQATLGFILGLAILSFPGWAAWQLASHPPLSDIATDWGDPPSLAAAASARRALGRPPLQRPPAEAVAEQRKAYPEVTPRRYPQSVTRVFAAVHQLVTDRRWAVLALTEPRDEQGEGAIAAVAGSAWLGFPEDVAIRVRPEEDATVVDLRSASRLFDHDRGSNAARIAHFLNDLDAALNGSARR